MINTQRNWGSIHLSNDLLFGQVMQDPTLCKTMLEKLLGFSIERISYPEPQKTFDLALDSKGIRIDIFVKSEDQTKMYTVEMQTRCYDFLALRSRYYQSLADLSALKKGQSYDSLPINYTIFICTFDPFGKGNHKYTFQNTCTEVPDLHLNDGCYKLFFNTKGTKDDVPQDLKQFLKYFNGELSNDPYVQQLDEKIQEIINNEEWRNHYMTLEQWLQEELDYRFKEGFPLYAEEKFKAYAEEKFKTYAEEKFKAYAEEKFEAYAEEKFEAYAKEKFKAYAKEKFEAYAEEKFKTYAEEKFEAYAEEKFKTYAEEKFTAYIKELEKHEDEKVRIIAEEKAKQLIEDKTKQLAEDKLASAKAFVLQGTPYEVVSDILKIPIDTIQKYIEESSHTIV